MEFPHTAATVGAILIILQQILMMNTGSHRAKSQIGVGFADDRHLERKIRRHGNLAENAAIFIIVLSLAEMLSGGAPIIITFGAVFLLARLSHAFAFTSLSGSHEKTKGGRIFLLCRMLGALTTGLVGITLGGYVLYLLWFAGI